LTQGAPGTFIGRPELLPLIGSSGGGGGASASHDPNCSGGGGGGGGGAILIAANGTITVSTNVFGGSITAYGGSPGSPSNAFCASYGGYGSGGAIRLVANTITGNGSLQAYGSGNDDGAIRLEAITNTLTGQTGTRSGCQNMTLAITPSDGVPCRDGYAPFITPGTLGTDSTRNPRLH